MAQEPAPAAVPLLRNGNSSRTASADKPFWGEAEIDRFRRTIAKEQKLTSDEVELFVAQVNRTQLDPFARQIYAIKRGGKMQTQISIDGMRLIAERSGNYRGQTEPQWCDDSGQWKDVWLSPKPPAAARIGVRRGDHSEPTFQVATYSSYNAGGPMWSKMPEVMLSKVAEALALRKSFPQELSGLYSSEEMDQADQGASAPPAKRSQKAGSPGPSAEDAGEGSAPSRTDAPPASPTSTDEADERNASAVSAFIIDGAKSGGDEFKKAVKDYAVASGFAKADEPMSPKDFAAYMAVTHGDKAVDVLKEAIGA